LSYVNDLGYMPDCTPMDKAGNLTNHLTNHA